MGKGYHHQVEMIKWRGEKDKTWKLPKTIFICFICFFSKASDYSNSKHFVWFRHINSNCYCFLVNDLVAGVTNPWLPQLVTTQNYCVGPCICSGVMDYSVDATNHFITLETVYTFVIGFHGRTAMYWESLYGWINKYGLPGQLHILLLLSFR